MSEAVDAEGDIQRDGEPQNKADDETVHQGLAPEVPWHEDGDPDVQQHEHWKEESETKYD